MCELAFHTRNKWLGLDLPILDRLKSELPQIHGNWGPIDQNI